MSDSNKSILETKRNCMFTLSTAISADGKEVVASYSDKIIKTWNLDTKQEVHSAIKDSWTRAIIFSKTGNELIVGHNNTISILNKEDKKELMQLKENTGVICSLSNSPCGRIIVSVNSKEGVKLWDFKKQSSLLLYPAKDLFKKVLFTVDGNALVISHQQRILILCTRSGKLLRSSPTVRDCTSMALSPDGKVLAAGFTDGTITLLDLSLKVLHFFAAHSDMVSSMEFSPCQQELVSGSYDHTIKRWTLPSLTLSYKENLTEEVNCISYSPTGNAFSVVVDKGYLIVKPGLSNGSNKKANQSSPKLRSFNL